VTKTIAESWMEEGMAKGEARGYRKMLFFFLKEKFGCLPEELVRRIEAVTDPAKLEQAAKQAYQLEKLEDLRL
jgi:hypothetical protein